MCIVGASGKLGQYVVQHALDRGYEVVGDPIEPVIYQLRLQGRLGADWSDWLEGMTVSPAENGETLVTGPVIDQATLHGLLRKVRDVGIPLLAVNRIQPG